jgi:succinate dehydrogenase/fumarate reductase flavoprotein subunit
MAVNEQVDVVVVGTGCAACGGALGALLNLPSDAKVLVLEKSPKMKGGTTKLAGGAWAWFPRNHFLKSIGLDDPEDSVVDLLAYMSTKASVGGNQKPDAHRLELMRTFARESPKVLEELVSRDLFPCEPPPLSAKNSAVGPAKELEAMRGLLRKRAAENVARGVNTGARIDDEQVIEALAACLPDYSADETFSAIPSGRTLAPKGGTTSGNLLKAVGKFSNAEIRMGHEVSGLVRGIGGRVTGVKVKTVDGVKTIGASRGVIFGSGGYAHNQEMISAQHGVGVVSGTCSSRTNTGDLVSICEAEGVPVSHLDLAWWKQVVLPFDANRIVSGGAFFLNADSFMMVDSTGCRYSDEKEFYQQRGLAMLDSVGKDVDRRYVFFILDDRSTERFAGPLKGLGGPIPFDDTDDCLIKATGDNAEEKLAAAIQAKLGEITGSQAFPLNQDFAKNLKDQISRFNEMAKTGVDTEFARGTRVNTLAWHVGRQEDNKYPNKTMYPIEYGGEKGLNAIIMGLSTLDTKGGPQVNTNSQILGADGSPVPGLYGAGNCVCSYSERAYPAAGSTVSNGMTFGFIAGRHAAGAVPSSSKL